MIQCSLICPQSKSSPIWLPNISFLAAPCKVCSMFESISRSEAVQVVTTTEESSGHKYKEVVGCTGTTSLTNGVLTPLGPKQGHIYGVGSNANFYCVTGYLVNPDRNDKEAKVTCTAVHNSDGSVAYRWRFFEFPDSKGCAEGKLLPIEFRNIYFHPNCFSNDC